ncbi:MAG: peptidyl-prolyl cis-trans isomerase [Treponema sp.]|nr:peptidyl-prolyl cis-trans isomerase [Treponema sp.]
MKRILIVMICIFSAVGTVFAQSDLQSVAIVSLTKSEPITVKQLRTEVEKMEKGNGRALTVAERRQVLDVMINERLAIQAAERDRVTVSDAEINTQLQQLRMTMSQNIGRQPTDQEFELAIRNQTGTDFATFKNDIRKQLLVQKYMLEKKRSIFEAIKVPTEQEINDYYSLAKAQLVRPDTVRVSMISVPFGTDKAQSKVLVDRLSREIGSDAAKFDETVIKSHTPNSGYEGGDAGYLPKNLQAQQTLGADFVNTAFSLKQGEISKPIEGPRAYQIIKVTETYTQKNLELTDRIDFGSRMTVRDYIENGLIQQKQQAAGEKASQELVQELRQGNPFRVFDNAINW